MQIIAFAASSSGSSINKQLASYAARLIEGADIEILDLNDYELPLFSVDREVQLGHPQLAQDFLSKIAAADGLIISFAEHNSSYSAAYKNLFDWCSRVNKKVFCDKPAVFLSTSPGGRGGASVLAEAIASAPRFGAQVVATLSVPNFSDNFDSDLGALKNPELNAQLNAAVTTLKQALANA
ncbi:MAG TPA: NAD(P)H-dependent oxidoreductase [Cellvibrionaceae bacterium]